MSNTPTFILKAHLRAATAVAAPLLATGVKQRTSTP